MKKTIGFIGTGNMASAIIDGMVSSKAFAPMEICVYDKDLEKADQTGKKYGVTVCENNEQLLRQCRAALLGVVGMLFVSVLPIKIYEKLSFFAYGASILILFAVWTPWGVEAYGARRWVSIPLLGTFQPAELTKVGVIIFIPILICKAGHKIKDIKVMAKIAAYLIVRFNFSCFSSASIISPP